MYYIAIFIVGYLVGMATAHQGGKEDREFYKANCVAAVGETSIMVNDGIKPTCTVSTILKNKHGTNLKDWKE